MRSGVLVFTFALAFLLVAGPAQAGRPKGKPKLSVTKVDNPQRRLPRAGAS